MAQLTEEEVQLSGLLLDPNNYRFQADEDFVRADVTRAHEETVQDRAYSRLRLEDLAALKNSILTNGFLPFERLARIVHDMAAPPRAGGAGLSA
jgi:hypothetical protein